MLIAYRRHKKACRHRDEGRRYRNCECPVWVDGFLGDREIRESLRTRNWQVAQRKVRDWEVEDKKTEEPAPEPTPVSISEAWEQFLNDCEVRSLREPTIRKYSHLARQMHDFAQGKGLRFMEEFDVETLRVFRSSWPNRNLSALKKLELLRSFFRFCSESGWITGNPAKKIRNPKINETPTLPFTQEEVIRILSACEHHSGTQRTRLRLRALVLLLRYSGLRISDAVTLARGRIVKGKMFLYTSKAGTPVHCPLPDFVIRALEATPTGEPYYFWTGQSKPKTAISHWQRELQELFRLAEVERGHAHRFRDTFAIELLLAGVPMERVSVLLGHRSIKVTEKHYSPWIRARQEQLEADVRRTWATDSVAFAETNSPPGGTPGVHGKGKGVN